MFAELFPQDPALERLNAELEGRVTGKNRSARSSTQAPHRKDEFLAMLAHELRNPLAPIRTRVQLLRLTAANRTVRARAR